MIYNQKKKSTFPDCWKWECCLTWAWQAMYVSCGARTDCVSLSCVGVPLYLSVAYIYRKEVYLVHSWKDWRMWCWHLLGSGQSLIAEGVTVVENEFSWVPVHSRGEILICNTCINSFMRMELDLITSPRPYFWVVCYYSTTILGIILYNIWALGNKYNRNSKPRSKSDICIFQ